MLTTSLILLNLSNAVTLSCDKSILYSRATITMLIVAIVISILLIHSHISLENPKPHGFVNLPLQSSSSNSNAELDSLLQDKKNLGKEMLESNQAVKTVQDAIKLDNMLEDKSKNASMKDIMSHYEEFFDEESGNTKQQGLQQLQKELKDDYLDKKRQYHEATKKLDQFNSKSILLLICPFTGATPVKFVLHLITLLLSILSLMVSFSYIFPDIFIYVDIYIPDVMYDIRDYILSITIHEVLLSLTAFTWSSYKTWSDVKRYFNMGTLIFNYTKRPWSKTLQYILYLSIITFVITFFMFMPEELLNIANILALILFNK